ncbi:beta strand repeat-containing protein [Peribacillus acanthi]|uniref:beta strand repeat-containing protein n=1 Tax=Peribacillus acanthi TaxID=2171554 RepID=UPI000D3E46D4|nr:S-layer homology domain-containing protein [Peribacillus acanthi]
MAYQPKSYRKFVATAATATLVASAVAPVASLAAFKDVQGEELTKAVDFVVAEKIAQGYADGVTFGTADSVKRIDAAVMIAKALKLDPATATASTFTDVPKDRAGYVNALYAIGAVNGKTTTQFDVSSNITRAEMAKILVDAFGLVANNNSGTTYSDVSPRFKNYVKAIVDNGAMDAASATSFGAEAKITRGEVATALYRIMNKAVAPSVVGVSAINATTVEVAFKDAVTDVESLDFSIEGLKISNAAVKQTDSKVVVLTTEAQTGDKEYTVKSGETTLGKFKGLSAVIPTGIKVTTPSIQGTLGKEVTVKASVTVPEGQSKAGIPVTFNITNSGSLNAPQVVEVKTNADGVASYSYTRYQASNDSVVAYSTGDRTKFSTGTVYWANSLTLTEVTESNTLANGAKKVYKVKANSYATAYDAAGNALYNYVNVAFAENLDVTPDKLVRGVNVIDTGVTTNASYPSQVTTGGVNEVRVKVNASGEATFTLTGANASVTPIVFVDADTKNGKLGATELQASASTVKFELTHTLGLAITAKGVTNAAAMNASGVGVGGRDYTVTVTDKDGKVAPAGTKAYVTFAEGSYSTDKAAYILNADGSYTPVNKNTRYEITVTGTKGEATFTLVGNRDAFAAPTVYLETGSEFALDKNDLQVVGETTYFVNAVVTNATLTATNAAGKAVSTLPSSQSAFFNYQSVDQNGFDYYVGTGSYEVSYQVTAHFADVTVFGTFGSKLVKKGTTETVKVQASAGKASLEVRSENVSSNVTVQASASQVSLPNQSATIAFTKGTQLPSVYTGAVTTINTATNSLTFAGYDAVKYSTSSFKNAAGVVIDEAKFESLVGAGLAAGDNVLVTAVQNADGTYTLEIESITPVTPGTPGTGTISTAVLSADGTKLTLTFDKNLLASSVVAGDFTTSDVAETIAIGSVSGNTVVLNVTNVAAASTVDVVADNIVFADGTSNAVLSKAITQPVVNKISVLTTNDANVKAAAEVLAKGSVTVGAKTATATVATGEVQEAFNGLKIKFVQDGTSTGNPAASYNATTNEVTVSLGYVDANNTLALMNTAIQGLTDNGNIDFSTITLTGTALAFADVAAAQTITLAGGVSLTAAQVGEYEFTLENNLTVGDVITLNGKTYVAGTDFVVGSSATVTAANLAAAIVGKDTRFATAVAAVGVITLTDAVADGAAAPTLSIK